MPSLLLELFSEEIPARMQQGAIDHLANTLTHELNVRNLAHGDPRDFVTPRRLAVFIPDIPIEQADTTTELKGPKVDAPAAALEGFLKKSGLAREQLEVRDGVYFARVHQKGRPTAVLLQEIIEKILAEFPWPKSMRWGAREIRWVRPLHSILCVFDGKVVPVQFGHITAGNVTYGHRFMAPAAIPITDVEQYEPLLRKAHVIAHRASRRQMIQDKANSAAAEKKLRVHADEGLLDEVTGLVEWPVVLVGTIDAKFMDLPPEVLISEMRGHQKYFALQTADGKIAPHFLITANMETNDGGKAVIAGNERVLRARLSDGRFFWDQDRKKTLDAWAENLAQVTYHAKLGTITDKVKRVEKLAATLVDHIPSPTGGGLGRWQLRAEVSANAPLPTSPLRVEVIRAAQLCKADLTTGMVGEFPELQGVMGRYYACHQGEAPAVADAIAEHYKPLGPSDSVPTAPVSVCVALADKLDTLVSMFAIGEKPTGSKDPFALRRAALGVIRIVLENAVRISCGEAAAHAADTLTGSAVLKDPAARQRLAQDVATFFHERLKVQLKDQGMRHDVIAAVAAGGDDDLVRVVARAVALQSFLATENGANLLAAYKRAANILAIEEKKDKTTYAASAVQASALKETEEKNLLSALGVAEEYMRSAIAREAFEDVMKNLAGLRAPLDAFFEKILVNCDDKTLRASRLALLAAIRDVLGAVADFSKIEG